MKSTTRLSSTKSMPNFAAWSDGERDSVTRAINRRRPCHTRVLHSVVGCVGWDQPRRIYPRRISSSLYVNASGARARKEAKSYICGKPSIPNIIRYPWCSAIVSNTVCIYAALVSRKLNLIQKKRSPFNLRNRGFIAVLLLSTYNAVNEWTNGKMFNYFEL